MAVTTPLAHAALLSTSVLDSGVLLTPFAPRFLEHLLFSVGVRGARFILVSSLILAAPTRPVPLSFLAHGLGVIRVVVRKGARHFIVSLALALVLIRHLIMHYGVCRRLSVRFVRKADGSRSDSEALRASKSRGDGRTDIRERRRRRRRENNG